MKKQQTESEYVKDPADKCAHLFGDKELNRSQADPESRFTLKYVEIKDINESLKDQEINIRGRLHAYRAQSKKLGFMVLREKFATIQCVVAISETLTQNMSDYTKHIPKESIVEIKGKVTIPEKPVKGCSQHAEI